MVFAQSVYDVVEDKVEIKRSFKFTHGTGDFPVTSGDHSSLSGLGFEFFAFAEPANLYDVLFGEIYVVARAGSSFFGKLMSSKNSSLAELMAATARREVISVCHSMKICRLG